VPIVPSDPAAGPALLDPPEGTQALLFDCDGTLVDTMGLYRICWRQVFGRYSFEMTDEWFDVWAGHSVTPFVGAALPDADEELLRRVGREGVELFLESTHLLEPLERVVELARRFHGRIPLAVVSAGPREAVVESLAAVGITDLFDEIVTGDDVERTKPAPDGYLQAMRLLGVAPDRCVAYEDTSNGMESARAAGIRVVIDVRWHDG
jgi:beta-phosphoglucomutase-like phosphatase (HAD superfamily)